MFLVLCILLTGAGYYWYLMTTLTIQDNTMKLSRQIINQMNSRLDAYFMEIVNLTLPMAARNVSAQFLDRSGGGPYERLLYARPGGDIEQAASFLTRSLFFKRYNLLRQQIVQYLRHFSPCSRACRIEPSGVAADASRFDQKRHGFFRPGVDQAGVSKIREHLAGIP